MRWGGDEFLFYLDRPYGEKMTAKVNKYMDDLLTALRNDGPLDGRWGTWDDGS
ncbi:MAG: hypothetical protein MZV70_36225 [Desulfobacterales bacterium]|nr:hypothetical protein [Desulfobacterales bacterium]